MVVLRSRSGDVVALECEDAAALEYEAGDAAKTEMVREGEVGAVCFERTRNYGRGSKYSNEREEMEEERSWVLQSIEQRRETWRQWRHCSGRGATALLKETEDVASHGSTVVARWC
ncbi:hypothetical protein PIB30_062789 [Stylosanthes scabra]|uniref:Uncharacterized protein n=1 Tax=Stylosanthes scabra TaxID=79078 RepID=A0ABU6SMN5_9FABA|nr:hypothetical protein [Stylosanthes scabra]